MSSFREMEEKYDVDYIAREAALLIRYFGKKKNKNAFTRFDLKPVDVRIMQRWGLR